MNVHHRWMLAILGATVLLVIVFGVLYGVADHCGTWNGLYFAVVTVTTVGYGDITPVGWAAHLVAIAVMVLIIPLWTGVFSLLTSGLITRDAERRHEDIKQHVTDRVPQGPAGP